MTVRVSVVIPTYNRAADLARALGSIFVQTFAAWEVIVVDNRSNDGTRAYVEGLRDPRLRFIEIDNGGVVAASRNAGWRASRGEYVALLDSDDWWKPRKLELSVAALDAGADIVYHDLLLARRAGQRLHLRRSRTRRLQAPAHDDLLEGGNALTNSSVVVRRKLLEAIGGISEERALIAFEDYDTWLRLAQVTGRFTRLPQALGYYWTGGANLSTPERTIRNLEHFKTTYSARADAPPRLPGWYHYGYGRACYHLNNHIGAIAHMRAALTGRLVASKRVKAHLTIAASLLRRLRGAA